MKQIPSTKFPEIAYIPGESIWIDNLIPDNKIQVYLSVSEKITQNEIDIDHVSHALDHMDELVNKARAHLRDIIQNTKDPSYKLLHDFFDFHRLEMDDESLKVMFGMEQPRTISELEMVNLLMLKSLGSSLGEGWLGREFEKELKKQIFIMDFTFDPEYTDQLIVVYLDANYNILTISHES
ncbi:DUF2004 domain-containing protein [Paenibacillus macquariensis]|uniref:DUF2004 domain-containing protein n=1 Tax=Paenibacillus macquariensis TaxID=948756 RepID=A0ABY1JUY2_9BACL|nr:DUF2004 domain-containing protein [Paenibacillus macquariensis]MEC0090854.1 DUF2004 domain-containing protein [Paenibacillus macquariensis]OAB34589.1 hypothetical protein PMSM_12070 [Paenibacillus macquariensis subsp. macquariensis]SIQ82081.1 Protein of unknown function [Paenibacillus macquariensis]